MLSDAGGAIDFVIVHWYPSPTSAASMLTEPAQVAGELAQLRQEIDQYAGPDGPDIQIAMTDNGATAASQVLPPYSIETVVLGTSTSGSFTVNNLVPGTAYTFNVLARDQAGYLSLPSTPVTFTTSTPSNSTCQVSYAVTQGWGDGFVANISITSTGPGPIDGWTLAFSFPASSESVSSDWNGTWSETGQAVTVTNLSWDGTLADGGNTVDIGFVGANDGAYPSPAAFTLNGTVCATTYSS